MQKELIADFMKINKIAVIGASSKPEKWGYKIFKILRKNNFEVFPVHKSLKEIEGVKVYSSLNDIEEEIEACVFVVNPEIGLKISEEVISNNIKYVWLQPGTRSEELINKLKDNNIDVVHTECIYVFLNNNGRNL